jgi:hypothetical protein
VTEATARLCLIGLAAVLASCAAAQASPASATARYTLATTKRCLATKHVVEQVGRTGNLVIRNAPGGAVHVVLRTRNDVALGFYGSATGAKTTLFLVTRVRSQRGQTSPSSEFHTRRNVYVGWHHHPTRAQLEAVEGCLR